MRCTCLNMANQRWMLSPTWNNNSGFWRPTRLRFTRGMLLCTWQLFLWLCSPSSSCVPRRLSPAIDVDGAVDGWVLSSILTSLHDSPSACVNKQILDLMYHALMCIKNNTKSTFYWIKNAVTCAWGFLQEGTTITITWCSNHRTNEIEVKNTNFKIFFFLKKSDYSWNEWERDFIKCMLHLQPNNPSIWSRHHSLRDGFWNCCTFGCLIFIMQVSY